MLYRKQRIKFAVTCHILYKYFFLITCICCMTSSLNGVERFIEAFPNILVTSGAFYAKCWKVLPEEITKVTLGNSLTEDCPVPMNKLAYLQLAHWNFHGDVDVGELIVHQSIAEEIIEIFHELFDGKFPIDKMVLIDEYDCDDALSMEDNNSSAFCCRSMTGKSNCYSIHSYGTAIDINPRLNPYIKGTTVLPQNGRQFLNRTLGVLGMICEGDLCYRAFVSRGYQWGGHWQSLKDYQHFEKKPEL